jgi:RnfABCDGE-type electron transport complex B subunit
VEPVLVAAAVMGGLSVFFGAVLAIANRFLKVEEDPRLDVLESMLPGTNCGACGEPGCRAFAEALVAGKRAPGTCTVSSPEGVGAIADYLGVESGTQVKRVARLHCAGGRAQARQIADYEGFSSCRAAALVAGGGKGCAWGCLGLADCERACTFDAIDMNANGLPVVDPVGCTACGDCVTACPRDLFEILPIDRPLIVQCRIPLAGEAATALCSVACDACGRCAQDAPGDLIRMSQNLPIVDYVRQVRMGPEPTFRCPTGAIRFVRGRQFGGDDSHGRDEDADVEHRTSRA